MAFARDLKNTVLRIAAEQGDMPIFYRHFEPLRRPGQVGGHWLHNVKKILIESGFVVHERDKGPAWDNCNSKTSYTHFHRSYLKQNVASPMQRKYAEQNLSDSFVLRNAIDELRDLYKHFPLESTIWEREGRQRDPYRTLIVMGLSQRVADKRGNPIWREFLTCYPSPERLRMSWLQDRARVVAIVNHLGILTRSEQIIKAAISFGDMIPSQRDHLMEQRGIGETVAEKIIGYGFGKPALPLDGQANRVVSKLRGISENENAVRSKLKDIIPKTAWMEAHELLRLHGQAVCTKNRPSCSDCPLSNCRSRLDTWQGSTHRAQYRAKEAMNSWAEWRQLLLEP